MLTRITTHYVPGITLLAIVFVIVKSGRSESRSGS